MMLRHLQRFLLATATAGVLLVASGCVNSKPAHAGQLDWMTDFAAAQARAKAENKRLLMDFTGSDWCPPCIQLHKTVLTSKEFGDYARANLVLVMLDFPEGKAQPLEIERQNKELAELYKIEGFPTVIVLDSEGKELKRQSGYSGMPATEYVAALEKLGK